MHLRNRKQFVSTKLQKHEKCCGNIKASVFMLFRVLPNCLETGRKRFLFPLENSERKKKKSLVYCDHQNTTSTSSLNFSTSKWSTRRSRVAYRSQKTRAINLIVSKRLQSKNLQFYVFLNIMNKFRLQGKTRLITFYH